MTLNGPDKIRKPHLDSKGFTLIEVLLSLAIFAVGFLAIGTLVIVTTKNTTTGNMMTQATMLAREKIEFLKTLPLDDMAGECLDSLEPEVFQGVYNRRCDVTPATVTLNALKVTVTWTQRQKLRSVVLETTSRGNGS